MHLVLIVLMSSISKIYDELERAHFANGTMYSIGADNHVVELMMYAGFIINAKCRGRTLDETIDHLKVGDFKQVKLTEGEVRLESIHSTTLLKLAPLCAADALKPSSMNPQRMALIISLIAHLDASEEADGLQAALMLTSYIEQFYATFSLDRTAIQKRITSLGAEHNIIIPSLHQDMVPLEAKRIPGWIMSVLSKVPSRRLRSFAQYYVLFGESPQKMLGILAKKDTSLGAKPGFIKLSKALYAPYSNSETVTLFGNLRNAGDYGIIWHSENKRELLITKADFERSGLGQSDTVVVLFH